MIKGIRFYFLANIFHSFFYRHVFQHSEQHKERLIDVYIIWIHVPAGFAHTDDTNISLSGVFDLSYLKPFQEK